jgi:hypothetical protein
MQYTLLAAVTGGRTACMLMPACIQRSLEAAKRVHVLCTVEQVWCGSQQSKRAATRHAGSSVAVTRAAWHVCIPLAASWSLERAAWHARIPAGRAGMVNGNQQSGEGENNGMYVCTSACGQQSIERAACTCTYTLPMGGGMVW